MFDLLLYLDLFFTALLVRDLIRKLKMFRNTLKISIVIFKLMTNFKLQI